MNKLIGIISALFIFCNLFGQQSSSFAFNEVQQDCFNPSISILKNQWSATVSHRLLLTNYSGAPMNNLFAFNTNLKKKHGFGIVVSQANRSIYKDFEGYLNYAYGARLGGPWKIGFGLGAGVKSQSIDLSNQVYFQQDDPFLVNQNYSSLTYDARFGAFLSSSRLLVHISALQLIGQRFNNNISKLSQNFIAGGEYRIDLPKKLVLRPMASANIYITGPMQYNIGAEITYNDAFGIGAQYRSGYALTPTAFVNIKNFKLGYGFDLIQFGANDYGFGHEVYLKFSRLKFDSKVKMISKELATEEVYELIDSYFDVQNSKIDIVEKKKLLNHIRNEIYELLPYMDDESRKKIEKDLKKQKKKNRGK